jgi:acetolactate synthase I/II/III large subunit
MAVMTGAQAFVQALKLNGIDTVFGLPGVQLDYIFDALYHERNAIRVINSRHEQGVAYMAYGYAESTGRLGAFLVVPGPGVLNTCTAVCTMQASNTPVLALTGQISRRNIGRGLGILHELSDQSAVFAPLTKGQFLIDHASKVASGLSEAATLALSGRGGPVLFQVPDDVTVESADVTLGARGARLPDPVPDQKAVEQAAAWLGAAKKPLIIAGGGAFGAEKELQALAEALQAPVMATRHGRGAMSDRHYLAQTVIGGHLLWPEVDAVLAVGTRYMEGAAWGSDARMKTIRIDIDPMQAEKPSRCDCTLIASARDALAAIRAALPAQNRASRQAELEDIKKKALEKLAVLEPQKSWSDAIRGALPDNGRVVADITQIGFYGWNGFPAYEPRSIIYPGFQDSLGYAYATSLGVKVAHPDKPVVAICGDGGFMFTMPELASAVQHGINSIAIVFNDSGFGNVRRTQKQLFDGRYHGSDLTNPDFMGLAKSFGILGLRSKSPAELGTHLKEAIAAKSPALIEVPVGAMPSWQALMPRNRVRG